MFDVFISHSSKDKDKIVYPLVQQLKQRNIGVWLDADEILAGDTIISAIEKGIANAFCTVLIITPSFLESFWTPLEIGLTLSKQNTDVIIPVLCNVTVQDIYEKFPPIFNLKYLKLNINDINACADELADNISKIKEKKSANYVEILLKKAIKKFNSCNSPTANTVSILLSEYEQIVEINVQSAILHASQIANTIINDLYGRLAVDENVANTIIDKLNILKMSSIGLNENIYEHLKLLSTPALDANIASLANDNDRRKLAEMSITAVLDWYSKYLLHHKIVPHDELEIVWSEELTYKDFITMHEIDKLVLREDLIAPPQVTYAWYQYNNYTHIAIRSTLTNKIVGYFTVLPVTDQLYSEIQSGYFKDNDLSTDNLRKYDVPDFYKLYIACVCIHPEFQNTTAFSLLYNALLKMLMELAVEREIYVTNIITEASTLQGEKFCNILGLKRLLNTQIGTKIYGATLLPPSWQLKSSFGSKLIKYYKEKYEELKELF